MDKQNIKLENRGFNINIENSNTMMIMGSKGSGKTTVIASLFGKEFSKRVSKVLVGSSQGKKCRRLNNRYVKFNIVSGDVTDNRLVIGVRLRDSIYLRGQFQSVVLDSYCSAVLKFRNGDASDYDVYEYFKSKVYGTIVGTMGEFDGNLSSVFSAGILRNKDTLLEDYRSGFTGARMAYLYNVSKNRLSRNDKNSESAIRESIRCEVRDRVISAVGISKRELFGKNSSFLELFDYVNSSFLDKVIKEFGESKDCFSYDEKYYYRSFSSEELENDVAFLDRVFNDDSYRLLVDEIVVSIPMNEYVEDIIKAHEDSCFVDSMGMACISVYDYNYNFDDDFTRDDKFAVVEEFMFEKNISGVICLRDYLGGNSENDNLIGDISASFNKRMPLFVIHNKIDMAIDRARPIICDDILGIDGESFYDFSEKLDVTKILSKYSEMLSDVKEALSKNQEHKKKKLEIYVNNSFSKLVKGLEKEFIDEYKPSKNVEMIIDGMAKSYLGSKSIECRLDNGFKDIEVIVSNKVIKRIVEKAFDSAEGKKHVGAMKQNILENFGMNIGPDALGKFERKLMIGEGIIYVSRCDMGSRGINVQFPSNIKNILSDVVFKEIVEEAIEIKGIRFDSVNRKKFVEMVVKQKSNLAREVVRKVLYDNVLNQMKREFVLAGEGVIFENYLKQLFECILDIDKMEVDFSGDFYNLKDGFAAGIIENIEKYVIGVLRERVILG
ncbi:hypothetical protein [uncultured Clostridium sp.]|uniref:hypothetical protein n=1 Tax=uncultured Clostridium sp. TaxID=59620 RepID=UPI002637DA24|nr:hypothetical protein [uncultured Clostridium sp.]